MKDIFILQAHTGTIPGNIIKLFTRYNYSHVLLSLDNNFKKMYSFGRKKVYNPFSGGFVIEDIDGKFFNRFYKTKCRIYKLTISEEQYNSLKNILLDFEKNKNEYKYDFLGILLKLFYIPIERKKYFVCTHFIAEVLDQAKIYQFAKPNVLIRPRDFENIDNSTEIYIGLLKEAKRIV